MSIQQLTTGGIKISGVSDLDELQDLVTQGQTSTVLGLDAGLINEGTLNTFFGFEAGRESEEGSSNVFLGYRAGYDSEGNNNTFLGNFAGISNVQGGQNIYIGASAGQEVVAGGCNVLLGNYTGNPDVGVFNVYVGFSNASQPSISVQDGNVSVGALANTKAVQATSLGYSNQVINSDRAIVIGCENLTESARRSIVIGCDIVNRGRDALIVRPGTQSYINDENEHVNIADLVYGNRVGTVTSGFYQALLTADDVVMRSRSASTCNFVEASPTGVHLYSDDIIRVESPLTEMTDSVDIRDLLVQSNAQVRGKATFDSNLLMLSANGGQDYWMQYVNASNELIFESKHGATMALVDEFRPGVMNFTAKHRCVFCPASGQGGGGGAADAGGDGLLVGSVVIAVGEYEDLEGRPGITEPDEAVPKVALCTQKHDRRVFGVIGEARGRESEEGFHLGNLVFYRHRRGQGLAAAAAAAAGGRVIVQAGGEGVIRVCDANGLVANGDYITTSDIPGLGMRQRSRVKRSDTVAKATSDCDFSNGRVFAWNGRFVRDALIGCTYCCT